MAHAARTLAVVLFLAVLGAEGATAATQDTRRMRRIPIPDSARRSAARAPDAGEVEIDAALPTREQCEAAAREIAASYGPRTLEPYLSERFPYRDELAVALDRAGVVATSIALQVESIERVEIGPWLAPSAARRDAAAYEARSECLVDIRTRLVFDDVATGRRTVRPVGRAEWRIEFLLEVTR